MDITKDKGYINILKIKVAHPGAVPEYIENSDLDKVVESSSGLGSGQYANPMSMEYPLNSKEATWTSAAYYSRDNSGNELAFDETHPVWGNIKRAADIWGIADDVDTVARAYSVKPSTKYAESWGWDEDGERLYPLHTIDMAETAMGYFHSNRDKYPREMRTKIARSIYTAAKNFGLIPTDTVRKEAGMGYPDRVSAIEDLRTRSDIVRFFDQETSEVFSKFAEALENCPSEDLFDNVDKCVKAVEYYDKKAGLHYEYRYGSTRCVTRPTDSFYKLADSDVDEMVERFVTLSNTSVDCVKLAEHVPVEVFNEPFDDDYFQRHVYSLTKRGEVSPGDPASKVVFKVIGNMSPGDRWILENHLSGEQEG